MRILGLDLGSKTIGIALSDELGLTAQPLTTLKRKGVAKDFEEINALISAHRVHLIVVGMPVNMDGTMGKSAGIASAFIERLREKTGVAVTAWDERLSTVAVTRVLVDGDISRARRKEVVDKMAAAYILQGYLDSLKNGEKGLL